MRLRSMIGQHFQKVFSKLFPGVGKSLADFSHACAGRCRHHSFPFFIRQSTMYVIHLPAWHIHAL
jgi:hypothetical protein